MGTLGLFNPILIPFLIGDKSLPERWGQNVGSEVIATVLGNGSGLKAVD